MADTYQIEIKFNPKNRERPFGLPERVEVERGTKIEWVINYSFVLKNIFFSKKKFRRGMKFTIYFEDTSAFEWKSESLLVIGFPRFPLHYLFPKNNPIKIASGKAENEGDHKYGLRLMSTENDDDTEPEYDDDPYITVK